MTIAYQTKGIPESFVKNCLISTVGRDAETLFIKTSQGVFARLDGYAVIPREEYERLKKLAGEEPE